MRLRIHFAKTEAMRFTGHLDLHRAWERTFRRAGLPLAYSQGFSPHPRLNLACALPLGFTSTAELLDAWLEAPIALPGVETALNRAVPPGIQIQAVYPVDERAPTLQTILEAAEYTITFLIPFPGLEQRLQALLSAASLPRERRGKAYDLRPLLLDARQVDSPDGGSQPCLLVCLAAREGATGRPEELIEVLGAQPVDARVHRTRLIFKADI